MAQAPNPLRCLQQLLAQEGPRGLLRGFGATLAREIPGNALFFTVYEGLHRQVASRDSSSSSSSNSSSSSSGGPGPPTPGAVLQQAGAAMLCGGAAGSVVSGGQQLLLARHGCLYRHAAAQPADIATSPACQHAAAHPLRNMTNRLYRHAAARAQPLADGPW
jgi:hypothetical protein